MYIPFIILIILVFWAINNHNNLCKEIERLKKDNEELQEELQRLWDKEWEEEENKKNPKGSFIPPEEPESRDSEILIKIREELEKLKRG